MKFAEDQRGMPLAGVSVKVASNVFMIGLSQHDAKLNLELLEQRSWFDIPTVYAMNSRAIVAVEKGASGQRAIAAALAAWRTQ